MEQVQVPAYGVLGDVRRMAYQGMVVGTLVPGREREQGGDTPGLALALHIPGWEQGVQLYPGKVDNQPVHPSIGELVLVLVLVHDELEQERELVLEQVRV